MTVLSNQTYRPEYHFTPPSNWMNDPNGMVYFNGNYHLFYQHHPHGATWGPMHWGHAVSADLVNWEHRQIALAPDEHGMIFSGSAVVDWNDTSGFFGGKPGLVAIFTHHDEVPGTIVTRQRQSLAYSEDGRTWTKYADNPVLADEKYVDFRDPKVFWHEGSGRWVMILACGQTVCLYHSPNLKDWTFASEFGDGIGSHDGVWECPDLFPLPVDGDAEKVKWVMFVSIGNDPAIVEGSRTQYFTGEFDGVNFMSDEDSADVRWVDYGRDNYAGVSWSDIPAEDGRRLYLGWMSNWRYANLTPTEGWRSAMTIPRELSLETRGGEVTLVQRPARELDGARTLLLAKRNTTVQDLRKALSELRLDSYEIVAEFEASAGGPFGLKVRVSEEQETLIGYDSSLGELFVDRSRSGRSDFHEDFAGRHAVKLAAADGRLQLRVYVDRSSVEVFAGDGQAVMSELIFPDPEAQGLDVFAPAGDIILHVVELYSLSSKSKN